MRRAPDSPWRSRVVFEALGSTEGARDIVEEDGEGENEVEGEEEEEALETELAAGNSCDGNRFKDSSCASWTNGNKQN